MPPPPWPSASAAAVAAATHWIADTLAGDESLNFSALHALLSDSSDPLAGKATRERVALRSLQELSRLIPAGGGGGAVAAAGLPRVVGATSCEDVLIRLATEVERSGKLDKDLLPPFSRDIQETILAKKLTLPETSLQLLERVGPWITSMTPHSQLEHNATVTPGFNRTSDVLPTDASEPRHLPEWMSPQDTTMVSQPDSREVHLSALQHERAEKVNQDVVDVSASIQPVEKDHVHGGMTLQSASVLLSVSCNGANQGSKSETNLQPGTATTEDRMALEEQNADKSSLQVSGANKAYQALDDDGCIMKNNTVNGGLTVQAAPVSQNCNGPLHHETSEANCFSEQKNEKNGTDVQKDNCRASIPSSSKVRDRDGENAKKTSNVEKSRDTFPGIRVRSKDQDIDDTLEGLSQLDLCIKCCKDGQLLECSRCSLSAHDSCFGSSVTFAGTDLFCPVCCYQKATEAYVKAKETYCEARENLAAFYGTANVSKQNDEQLNGVQPVAANRDGHSNGCDTSKRNTIHQNDEAYDLAHQDKEPHQLRKKQKINATGNGYPKELLTEKVPFQNSGPASMNEHSVLQNNSKTRVEDPERKQQAVDKEAGNECSSHKRRASSQNEDGEAGQEDSHEKESAVPSKSGKGIAKQDKKKPTSKRKKSSVRPQKRYSNPVVPVGRRPRLDWTEAEEAILREAMELFTPQDGVPIPWIKIREYGHHVFHRTRTGTDLRDKWRNLMKKEPAGY